MPDPNTAPPGFFRERQEAQEKAAATDALLDEIVTEAGGFTLEDGSTIESKAATAKVTLRESSMFREVLTEIP